MAPVVTPPVALVIGVPVGALVNPEEVVEEEDREGELSPSSELLLAGGLSRSKRSKA